MRSVSGVLGWSLHSETQICTHKHKLDFSCNMLVFYRERGSLTSKSSMSFSSERFGISTVPLYLIPILFVPEVKKKKDLEDTPMHQLLCCVRKQNFHSPVHEALTTHS